MQIIGNPDDQLNDYLNQSSKNEELKEKGFNLCNGGEGEFMEDCKECEFFKDCQNEIKK